MAAILLQNAHHTPAYWWRGDSDEANQCMGMIRRPWWSEASGQILPGCRVNTPLFFEGHPGILMATESQDLGLTSHPKDSSFFGIVSPSLHWVLGPTQTAGWAPPAGLTNTSSSSNLVFIGGLPSRYWPAQPCLASVGNRSWNRVLYGCYKLYRWIIYIINLYLFSLCDKPILL